MDSDRMFADLRAGYARVLEFLDLPAWTDVTFRNWSATTADAGAYSVPDPPRERLRATFERDNDRLEALLDEEFAWP